MFRPPPTGPHAALSRRRFLVGAAAVGVLAGCGTPHRAAAPAGTAAGPAPAGTPAGPAMAGDPARTDVADDEMTRTAPPVSSSDPAAATTARPTTGRTFPVSHTDAQWHSLLTPEEYDVLRQAGTETPFSSPLNDEHAAGVFGCAGCALPLFSSTTKFDSGTGWPSFWQAMPDAVLERQDNSLGRAPTEGRGRRCGSHLGHKFDDGPPPTGARYCMNGLALTFRAT